MVQNFVGGQDPGHCPPQPSAAPHLLLSQLGVQSGSLAATTGAADSPVTTAVASAGLSTGALQPTPHASAIATKHDDQNPFFILMRALLWRPSCRYGLSERRCIAESVAEINLEASATTKLSGLVLGGNLFSDPTITARR
jgi:hypothetical protein